MRKRSYNLACCCSLDPLTLLSKEVNYWFETNLDERPFLSKIEGNGLRYSCCPGGLAALAILLLHIKRFKGFRMLACKTFENVYRMLWIKKKSWHLKWFFDLNWSVVIGSRSWSKCIWSCSHQIIEG